MSDPRQGLPSASNIESIQLCKGKLQAERGLPEVASEYSTTGTNIHEALKGDNQAFLALSHDDQKTYEICHTLAERMANEVLGGYEKCITEERLWITNGDGERVMSGQFDRLYIKGLSGIVIDFKTGRGDVTEAPSNFQLAALAALVRGTYSLQTVQCAIIQPWVSPQYSLTVYDAETLIKAEKLLLSIITDALKPDAPRTPGEKQCRYCKAKPTCPESQSAALQKVDALKGDLTKFTAVEIFESFKSLEKWFADWVKHLKAEVEAHPEAYPDFRLKPGAAVQEITNPTEVFRRASEHGVDQQSFLSCVKIGKGNFIETLKKASGKTGKELDALYQQITEGCTSTKQNQPSLERVK